MFKLRNGLFGSKKLLGATTFCFFVFLLFLGFYIYAVVDKPVLTDGDLLSTEGKFSAIAAGSQRGIAFIVKERDTEKLTKFIAIPGYTKIQSGFSANIGQNIVVQHYGRLVVSCRIDGVEYCLTNCSSESECGMNLYRTNVSALGKMVCTMFVLVVMCLVAYLIKRKRER